MRIKTITAALVASTAAFFASAQPAQSEAEFVMIPRRFPLEKALPMGADDREVLGEQLQLRTLCPCQPPGTP